MQNGFYAIAVLSAFACSLVHAQTPKDPQFEVATLKFNDPETPTGLPAGFRRGVAPGVRDGKFTTKNASLKDLVAYAYSVKAYQISGPSWIDSYRYDIEAKLPSDTQQSAVPSMLKALLAERLKMVTHRDVREMNVYNLVLGKGGPKFRALEPGEAFKPANIPTGASAVLLNGDMPAWGATLAPIVNRPVLDKTGLSGIYRVMLSYDSANKGNTSVPDIFAAIPEQLGLRLEPDKAPVDTIVVDSAEKMPAEN